MLTWQLVVWAYSFVGSTHEWVVARLGEAWSAVASAGAVYLQAGLGLQVLVAVIYLAIGARLAFQAEPVGAPAVVWYGRVFTAFLWLPAFAFGLGLGLGMMAYTVGASIAFYAGVFGLMLLPYEAVIRWVLALGR